MLYKRAVGSIHIVGMGFNPSQNRDRMRKRETNTLVPMTM
jgi:hypothetical protein